MSFFRLLNTNKDTLKNVGKQTVFGPHLFPYYWNKKYYDSLWLPATVQHIFCVQQTKETHTGLQQHDTMESKWWTIPLRHTVVFISHISHSQMILFPVYSVIKALFSLLSGSYQQMLHRNLVYLATIADSNQNMQSLLPAVSICSQSPISYIGMYWL